MSQAADSLPVTSNTPSSSSHRGTSEAEEYNRQSSSKELHWCIVSGMTVLALPIQLRNRVGAPVDLFYMEYDTMVAFLVALMVYLGSLAVKILQARKNPDLSEFMGKISLSSGTLAITLELLIVVPALGWFTFAAWSICLVIEVTKSYREIADVLKSLYQRAPDQLLQVFDKLKELIMNIGESAGVVASGMFVKLKEFFMNIGASAKVIASGMFDKLKELDRGSDQPNGASESAGDIEMVQVEVQEIK